MAGIRGGTIYPGPSWQFGVLPFMEQRNIYDKISNLVRAGSTTAAVAFSANGVNANVAGRPLDKLIPDYMRCPSSPLPVMVDQTGSICLPTYVGIAGGVDIAPGDTTLFPSPNQTGNPTSTRVYRNRAGATITVGGHCGLRRDQQWYAAGRAARRNARLHGWNVQHDDRRRAVGLVA